MISATHMQAGGHVSYLGEPRFAKPVVCACIILINYMSVTELRCLTGLKSNVHDLLDVLDT